MKIGFWGTPEIAAYCLESLLTRHQITLVVTKEDKPVGRQKKIQFSPVKQVALDHNLKILQPSNLKEPSFFKEIKDIEVDLFVVVAYGKIIPAKIYNHPLYKTINLHPSLLPKYRGAAPIQWALINGEKQSGIKIQLINDEMDAGDILAQETFSLDENETAAEVYQKVLPLGSEILEKVLNKIYFKEIIPTPQDEGLATYCQKIDLNLAKINWSSSSLKIHNLVRALNHKPGTWTTLAGKRLKVWKTRLTYENFDEKIMPGTLIKMKKELLVKTGNGSLVIEELQLEGKKNMSGSSFINGYREIDGNQLT